MQVKKDLSIVERGGIDHVVRRFTEFGANVREMSRTNKGFDLEVTLPGGEIIHVEVKATDDGQVRPKWLIQRHHRYNPDPRRFFVFVALDGGTLRATYVLSSATVAKHLDEMNTAYDMRNPTAKAVRPYKVVSHDSFLPQYTWGWMEAYNDKWDVVFAAPGER